MFTSTKPTTETDQAPAKPAAIGYSNMYHQQLNHFVTSEMNINAFDKVLEKEKQTNKADNWNKLDKSSKIQKLHIFAEKYSKENGYPIKEIKMLKAFFSDCLEKNKLHKSKEVIYDKEHGTITSIPALHFNMANHNFTLKIIDTKRVSTLKSLTPKRISEKDRPIVDNSEPTANK
jgi:hypothetical protein